MSVNRRRLMLGLAGTLVAGVAAPEVASAGDAASATEVASAPEVASATEVAQLASLSVTRTLRRGDSGAAVTALQRRLSSLGYWCGTADGSFGHLTQQAVWAVQKSVGLSRTGVTDAATRSAINAGRRPKPRTTSGNIIEIDKRRQILMVVRGGRLTWTLNTSTGSGQRYYSGGAWHTAYTPVGRMSVKWAYDGWRHALLGTLYRPRYFTWAGHAVHGSSSIPPYPASHGCARVSNAAMNLIWAKGYMPLKSTVYVY